MIPLREVLIRPGIIDSERVCKLPIACQLFFRNLLHACDGAGVFPADVAELKQAFYWRCPGVTRPHLEAWLATCHRAGLVNLYTSGGKGWGEVINYGQRDHRRKRLYPTRSEDELNFAAPADSPPRPHPPRPRPKPEPDPEMNRIEGKEKRARRATPAPEREETQEAWLQRLHDQHQHLDVGAQFQAWLKYCQKHSKTPDRNHFERHWLDNLGLPVTYAPGAAGPATPIEPEPEAWRAYLKDRYEDEGWAETAACCDWANMPANFRARIAREMKGAA
jgi:hypothetical protein